MNVMRACNGLLDPRMVITGNGTLFRRSDAGGQNCTGSFVNYLIEERKKVKVELKAAMRAGDDDAKERADTKQKVIKVLNNA